MSIVLAVFLDGRYEQKNAVTLDHVL